MNKHDDSNKPDAKKVLFGEMEPPQRPDTMTRMRVHLSPEGTTRFENTPEALKFFRDVDAYNRHKRQRSEELAAVPKIPIVLRPSKLPKNNGLGLGRDSLKSKDKGDDLER